MADTAVAEKPKRRRSKAPVNKPSKPRRRQSKKAPANGASFAVDFLGVSIGDGTARIGVKISRGQLALNRANDTLCGRRLHGKIILAANGTDPDQKTLVDDLYHEIESTFDVKRFSVAPDWLTCGLTFAIQEIEVAELAIFAKKQGRLIIDGVADIPARGDDEE